MDLRPHKLAWINVVPTSYDLGMMFQSILFKDRMTFARGFVHFMHLMHFMHFKALLVPFFGKAKKQSLCVYIYIICVYVYKLYIYMYTQKFSPGGRFCVFFWKCKKKKHLNRVASELLQQAAATEELWLCP